MLHKSLDSDTETVDDARRAHITLKAITTTATEEGIFEAVISTATVDRDEDIVEPAAMVKALTKWADLGKLVPLAWAHTEEVIGHIDPATVRVENREVIAKGRVDQNTPRGEEAWRLVKSGTLSFSFGYLIPKGGATKRPGGRFHIKELDVYEISVVPVGPANNDTRVLSFKSAEELREEAKRVERELEAEQLPELPPAPEVKAEPEVDLAKELDQVKAQLADVQEKLKAPRIDPETLRKEADRAAREVEQHQIPAVPEPPKAPDVPDVDLVKEFQEVKARLATAEQALEDLSKKADVTDKGTKSRSVDPLRKQAETVALEITSGGQSLRKPPKTAAAAPPELLPLDELKRRMRDEMLGVLSGGTIE